MPDPVIEALRELAPISRGQVSVKRDGAVRKLYAEGRPLRWVESGHGTPTVVLIAGRNDTALSWGPVLAALAGHAHAVAYDRAGLGGSDPGSGHAVHLHSPALVAEAILTCGPGALSGAPARTVTGASITRTFKWSRVISWGGSG